jgi:nitrogenase-associated protein
MPLVVFYEKPGCQTNARQKALLQHHGCELSVRDLLSEPWTETRLYAFLRNKPVAEWFNPASPRIKSGQVDPEAQDRHSAMTLLLQDPLLIRRPLLDTEFGKMAGFDDVAVLVALGVSADELGNGHQACSRPGHGAACPEPG